MYLWNYHALAEDLKHNEVSGKEKAKYLLTILLYVPTGVMGSNWIPGIYRLIYRITNQIVIWQEPRVPPIKIFNDFNYITDIAIPAIVISGVIICFIANLRGDNRNFIERFICLTVPITIRVSIYSLFLFLATLGGSLVYYNYKLQLISSIGGFFKIFRKLKQLKQLSLIMTYISHRMHVFSCILSLLSLIWIFFKLYQQIRFISRKHVHRTSKK